MSAALEKLAQVQGLLEELAQDPGFLPPEQACLRGMVNSTAGVLRHREERENAPAPARQQGEDWGIGKSVPAGDQ